MTKWITSVIEGFSYAGVAFLMFLENVFPPIPSELIMPLAGFVSTQGKLSFIGIAIAGTAGSVLGALPLYALGRLAKEDRLRGWLENRGHWIGVSPDDLTKAQDWFSRHGGKTVLLCRVVPGVRSFISIPAGIARMNLGIFLVYTTIGSAVWATALAYAGRMLGQQYEQVETFIGPISMVILGGIALMLIVRGIRQRRRMHAN